MQLGILFLLIIMILTLFRSLQSLYDKYHIVDRFVFVVCLLTVLLSLAPIVRINSTFSVLLGSVVMPLFVLVWIFTFTDGWNKRLNMLICGFILLLALYLLRYVCMHYLDVIQADISVWEGILVGVAACIMGSSPHQAIFCSLFAYLGVEVLFYIQSTLRDLHAQLFWGAAIGNEMFIAVFVVLVYFALFAFAQQRKKQQAG